MKPVKYILFYLIFIINQRLYECKLYTTTNQLPGRSVIVHLFEWKFSDIALECERWLGPKGFGAVQISPVNEHLVFDGRPWWERYQPISYKIDTRSGDRSSFENMTRRCNQSGVRIYVDVILNHMAGENPAPVTGTAGSYAYPERLDFPAVPYGRKHFNRPCEIEDWNNAEQMRNCAVSGLKDLNLTQEYVRGKVVGFLNELIDLGAAGFRIDSAKHIWPNDLKAIYSKLKNLNPKYFPSDSRPFVYHEIIDYGSQSGDLGRWEYVDIGLVTDFMIAGELGRAFRGLYNLKHLQNWGQQWNFLPSKHSIVFVDEHEFQRGYGYGGSDVLTHKHPKWYKMANAFMLAHPHGTPRMMSSYEFKGTEQGPPQDMFSSIISPAINDNGLCTNGWICEHRWEALANMIGFRNAADGQSMVNWWDNGNKQIAFSRGRNGFIAWNGDKVDLQEILQTCLPKGIYCDVITGGIVNVKCRGNVIDVDEMGLAKIVIAKNDENGVLAIHWATALSGHCLAYNLQTFWTPFWTTSCFRKVNVF